MQQRIGKPAALLIAMLLACSGMTLGGCDQGSTTGPIVESAESKKAGEAGRDAMKEFMESKAKAKPKAARPKS